MTFVTVTCLSVPFMAIIAQIQCFFRVTSKPSTCFGFCLLGSVFKFASAVCCIGVIYPWLVLWLVHQSICSPLKLLVCREPLCQHLVLSSLSYFSQHLSLPEITLFIIFACLLPVLLYHIFHPRHSPCCDRTVLSISAFPYTQCQNSSSMSQAFMLTQQMNQMIASARNCV